MTDEEINDILSRRLQDEGSAPFLFVGSGIPMRYLGLENWEQLLRRFAGLAGKTYPYYAGLAGAENYPEIASRIAEDFYDVWWSSDLYAEQREQFGESCIDRSSPLKLQIANYIRGKTDLDAVPGELRDELSLLGNSRIDGIITTNWDGLLEKLFPDYSIYIGQKQAIFSHTYSIAEIFKIHGCHTDPNSLVLTAEDYSDFNSRNAYLAAKLLTALLDHPILFLGYSLTDPNVRAVLTAALECLDQEHVEILRRRLLFIRRAGRSRVIGIADSTINIGNRDLQVTTVTSGSFAPVYGALAGGQPSFHPRLLREVKDHLYELVKTNDPHGKLAVIDIENVEQLENADFVVGIGVIAKLGEIGFAPLTVPQLMRDLVLDGNMIRGEDEARKVIEITLPAFLRGNRKYAPVYKYLRLAGILGGRAEGLVPEKVATLLQMSREDYEARVYREYRDQVRQLSVRDIVDQHPAKKAAVYLTFLDNPDLDQLSTFLKENIGLLDFNNYGSDAYKKLVCLYDRWRFGPGFSDR